MSCFRCSVSLFLVVLHFLVSLVCLVLHFIVCVVILCLWDHFEFLWSCIALIISFRASFFVMVWYVFMVVLHLCAQQRRHFDQLTVSLSQTPSTLSAQDGLISPMADRETNSCFCHPHLIIICCFYACHVLILKVFKWVRMHQLEF